MKWRALLICLLIAGAVFTLAFAALIPIVLFIAEPPREIQKSISESEYSFDPQTVQQSISEDPSTAFHFEWQHDYGSHPTPVPSSPEYVPLKWNEADFLRLAQASAKLAYGEFIDDAPLFGVEFETPCAYADAAPQRVQFRFFKTIEEKAPSQGLFVKREAEIDLRAGRVLWRTREYIEIQEKERALDGNTSHIPAETALRIAESAGGAAFRKQVNNKCYVLGYITAGANTESWTVEYILDETNFAAGFALHIDADGSTEIFITPTP